MTRRIVIVLLSVGAGLGLAQHDQPGKAADPVADKERAADRGAILKTFEQLRQAIGKSDADAVAAFWTDGGEYVSSEGEVIRGRKALVTAYKEFFARNKGVKVQGKPETVRFLGQD